MKTNGNDLVYESEEKRDYEQPMGRSGVWRTYKTTPLTKRELMATQIMAALCVPTIAGGHNSNDLGERNHKAKMAVNCTDALIAALNESKEG